MRKKPRRIDPEHYNKVVGAAGLEEILLVGANFSVKPDYFESREQGKEGKRKPSIEYVYGCTISDASFDADTGTAGATFNWELVARRGKKNLLKLHCSYLVYYSGLKKMEKEVVLYFVSKVGRFTSYPYFRAMASQFSWASGTNLPLLPVIRSLPSRKTAQADPKNEPSSHPKRRR
jgi:hypothetical protein